MKDAERLAAELLALFLECKQHGSVVETISPTKKVSPPKGSKRLLLRQKPEQMGSKTAKPVRRGAHSFLLVVSPVRQRPYTAEEPSSGVLKGPNANATTLTRTCEEKQRTIARSWSEDGLSSNMQQPEPTVATGYHALISFACRWL